MISNVGKALGAAVALAACGVWADETNVAPAEAKAQGDTQMVTIMTSKGEITVELNAKQAPETVKNFLQYVDDKHYDGTIFHRVIGNFMIQGGGFTEDMKQKPTRSPVRNESANGLENARGTLAMARTSAPDSATSQFFINVVDNTFLNRAQSQDGFGYCVFGKVVKGMDVVDAIRGVPTGNRGPFANVPLEAVVIQSITRAVKP